MNSFEMKISPKVSSGGARSSWKRLPKLPGLRPTDWDGSEKLGGGAIAFGAGETGSTLRHCAAETPAAPPQSESAPCSLHHIVSISLTKGCTLCYVHWNLRIAACVLRIARCRSVL